MKKTFMVSLLICFSFPVFAQQDTSLDKIDSLTIGTDTAGGKINNIVQEGNDNENANLTFKRYFVLLSLGFRQEFTKPFHMSNLDWERLGRYAVLFAGVSFADEPIQKFTVRVTGKSAAIRTASKYITRFGGKYESLTLASIAAYGVIFKKPKMVTTTLLATQAYLTSGMLESVIKFATGKTRPSYYSPSEEAEPKYLGPFSNHKDKNGNRQLSFPSGHATIAFAAATVFASEYKDKKYVPLVAYSAATLVALSRVTENKHWATDVITGAAIGYLGGKNAVHNYHHHGKLKQRPSHKNEVAFNIQYFNRQLIPGVIYKLK